jgi:hypothetical protein
MSTSKVLRLLLGVWLSMLVAGLARAEPAQVVTGVFVNRLQDISFRESRYVLDFYVWFRWKPEGALADYKPLESFELMNGRVDSKGSIVEKSIGDMKYASARVSATILNNWELASFPFDSHRLHVDIEDSANVADALVFVADAHNSRLGDEIEVPGWSFGGFTQGVSNKTYKSNYGDTSLPTDALSQYSRYTFGMDMQRASLGAAMKMLATVLAATLVSFVAFMIKPSDVDPRFGLGVGALFAVAASAFVVASAVPDSGVLTVADQMHMISMGFIFASLLQSAFCLKWDEQGREALYKRVDRWCLVIFPLTFVLWAGWIIVRAMR